MMGKPGGVLERIRTRTADHAHPTVCPSVHTMGSTCSSIRDKKKYPPEGKRSCTPNLDRKSHPSRGVGVSGTIKKG
jgi:hypothetical protein